MTANKIVNSLATVIYCMLLFLTMFLNLNDFVDGKILPKWYGFILFSFIGAGFTLFYSYRPVAIDKLTLALILLLIYMIIRAISGTPIIEMAIYMAILALYLFFQVGFQSYRIIEVLFLMCCLRQIVYAILPQVY